MTTHPFSRFHQRGRIDLGGVLVVLVLLALAAFFIFPRVQGDRFAKSERENIVHIHAKVREALGASSTDTASAGPVTAERLDSLKARNIFPESMFLVLSDDGGARNKPVSDPHSAWMTPMRLEPWQPVLGGSGVSVVYEEVPLHVCLGLLKDLPAGLASVDMELFPGAPVNLPARALTSMGKSKRKALCLPVSGEANAGVRMGFNFLL